MSEILESQIEVSPYALSPNAETLVYHISDDSSELHLRLPIEALLGSRENGGTDFEGTLEVFATITSLKNNTTTDTLNYSILAEIKNDSEGGILYHSKPFALSEGSDYKLDIRFTDKTRNTSYYLMKFVKKSNRMDRENFLLRNQMRQIPYFSSFIDPYDNIEINSTRVNLNQLRFYQRPAELTLPPPPSSSSQNKLPTLKEYNLITPIVNQNQVILTDLDVSDLLLKEDNSNGLSFLVRPVGYPEPSSVYEMIQPLRYISSRKEFEKMEGSSNLKQALDNFWLNCGDTKERSKELIAIFYARVEESNRFFTSYKSGWRTDRGLINIVFGAPNDLELGEGYEIWTYGDKTDLGSVQFKFNQVDNTFGSNTFELERNPIYKSEWARRVGAWRNGRIYN
ncbi:MAG: GWxTD domain-containing protein [Flavobacteriales bacterium]